MKLYQPPFKTQRARNEAYERIIRCLPLCDSVESLQRYWKECRKERSEILEHDKENQNDSGQVYEHLIESFRKRKNEIE